MSTIDPATHRHRSATPPGPPRVADLAVESAVLDLLLTVHPAPLTREELRRRLLATDTATFEQRDSVDRAVTEVLAHGAAHDRGGWLVASQAAVYVTRIDR